MNRCEYGTLVHRHRRMSYHFVACQDLLGDWIVAQFWNSLDQYSGRQHTLVYDSAEALERGLSQLVARRLHDGYELLPPSATHCSESEVGSGGTAGPFDNRGA